MVLNDLVLSCGSIAKPRHEAHALLKVEHLKSHHLGIEFMIDHELLLPCIYLPLYT